MQSVTTCPCCDSRRLSIAKGYRFYRPRISPDSDREALIDNIDAERLWILFTSILPDRSDVAIDLVRCRECSLYFTNPRLTDAEMRQKYEVIARYGFTKARYKRHPASRLDVRATRIFNLLKMVGCIPESGGVLDVGGAWGYNLVPFKGVARLFLIDPEQWPSMSADITWLGAGIDDMPPSMSFD